MLWSICSCCGCRAILCNYSWYAGVVVVMLLRCCGCYAVVVVMLLWTGCGCCGCCGCFGCYGVVGVFVVVVVTGEGCGGNDVKPRQNGRKINQVILFISYSSTSLKSE